MTRRPAPPAELAALAALLAAGADGALADMAAIQLLTAHRYWLTRADSPRRSSRRPQPAQRAAAGARPLAGRRRALAAGSLPGTGSETAILQIAASLAAGLPVRLRNAVTGLDHANLTAVAGAIMTAGGHHLP